ncbi:WD repeat-containing protein 20-like isoform X2 [Alosa alosa]|uniref:WD repeat-containing protein 20-like isoform X2 n=1 Tax=Alosa alosa TaxID=278164 RepID=UPI0020150A77|nr:WD repeat-containing protein 20-like isoform X2 [Alosa alosa]
MQISKMAVEGGGKEMNEIKTQFTTREGVYKLLTHSEYSRPNRVPFNSQGSNPVKVSFVNVNDQSGNGDRICFNVGRELYFYIYKGVRKAADLSKPIDKRIYKGTQPTCHDFNPLSATAESVSLLVGFSAGQVQLIDPIKKETSKLFNEERLIDKSRVTCVRWVPGSESLFLVSHASGSLYLYNVEHSCVSAPPHYQLLRQGDGFAVHTCKSKQARNPLRRWTVGQGTLNEFAFSPDGRHVACASQDGYLRVLGFDSGELHGAMKSYFGGLLCVCWSPDGRYVVAGGEDDLVTVWSFGERRVIARGHGHKSWVSVVAFDPCTTTIVGVDGDAPAEFSGSDDDFQETPAPAAAAADFGRERANSAQSRLSKCNSTDGCAMSVSYRFGSVGQDTQLCLWDLTEDILFPHLPLSRTRTHTNVMNATTTATNATTTTNATPNANSTAGTNGGGDKTPVLSHPQTNCLSGGSLPRSNSLPHSTAPPGGSTPNSHPKASSIMESALIATGVHKFATLTLAHDSRKERHHEKEHRRNHSVGYVGSKSNDKLNQLSGSRSATGSAGPGRTLGTTLCPHMEEVPVLEPLVCKKIAHERLTVLIFLDDCLVTACQEGFICTWARPGKGLLSSQNPGSSPSGTVV